eukprot:8867748-Pyramimonas_sp.AAC.1
MQPDSYEKHCQACETRITIRTEGERVSIIGTMEYKKGKDGHGRTLISNMAFGGARLAKGDVLQPTCQLPDVAMVDTQAGAVPMGDILTPAPATTSTSPS